MAAVVALFTEALGGALQVVVSLIRLAPAAGCPHGSPPPIYSTAVLGEIEIRDGFRRFAVVRTDVSSRTKGRVLRAAEARVVVDHWLSSTPSLGTTLHQLYPGPTVGTASVSGRASQLRRDVASGRIVLIEPEDAAAAYHEFTRAVSTGVVDPHKMRTTLASSRQAARTIQPSREEVRTSDASKAPRADATEKPSSGLPTPLYSERVASLADSHGVMSTVEAFTLGPAPEGNAIWDYVADPASWLPERRALHEKLLDDAFDDAMTFAVASEPGTLFAMRGNTGAGKSRATAQVSGMQAGNAAAKSRRHGSINPDNFKADLARRDGIEVTSTQCHVESSMLAERLMHRIGSATVGDGKAASFVLDKRLLHVRDVEDLAALAKSTGRKLHLVDVDAPLELSLMGVLMRTPGSDSPCPPFPVVGQGGFVPARSNRQGVMKLFIDDPSLGTYELWGTDAAGAKVKVLEISGEHRIISDSEMLAELCADPRDEVEALGHRVIDEESIGELTRDLPPAFGLAAREALSAHRGKTFEQALQSHSEAKPSKPGARAT